MLCLKRTLQRPQVLHRKSRKGVAALEFAVVAPICFLIIFGMVEFGRMVMIQQCVTNASRAGCRRATLATTTDVSQVQTVVENYLKTAIPDDSVVDVDVSPEELAGVNSGTPITVGVRVSFKSLSWLPVSSFNPRIVAETVQQRE
jgi:Flp pilus assembly protein TadG